MQRIAPVILSGGAGTRLWPLSRSARPKQFLNLTGPDSLLALTADRVSDAATFAPPLVVSNAAHAPLVAEALAGREACLILEPLPRNTAPAIALAALALPADQLMLVLPSDHVISDQPAFRAAVEAGRAMAQDDWLVTFGMRPDRAETGYGYIAAAETIAPGVLRVAAFVEKPDAARAKAFVAGGAHHWNAGIFLMRAGAYLAALEAHAPDMARAARAAMAGAVEEAGAIRPDAEAFARSPAQSIDYAVMEKAERVAVVPAAMGWSDVGSFDSLHALAEADADGNVADGETLLLDSRDCLLRSDGPLVAAIGVSDLVVIATGDAVLVARRGDTQRIKQAVEALSARKEDRWT